MVWWQWQKSGLIICESNSRIILFLGIHFPSFFSGGEFVKFFSTFDYFEKLLSDENSLN